MEIYAPSGHYQNVEMHPMPFFNGVGTELPRFRVWTVERVGHRTPSGWEAKLHTIVKSIGPDFNVDEVVVPRYSHSCYRRAARIAWLNAYRRNNGVQGRCNDSSIYTFWDGGYLGRRDEPVELLKMDPGFVLLERVTVRGFTIGSGILLVEKIPSL